MQSVIDGTRSQIGETVGALGHKADVKGRMAESVSKNPVRMVIGGAPVAPRPKALPVPPVAID